VEMQHGGNQSSANMVTKGGRGGGNSDNSCGGHGHRGGFVRGGKGGRGGGGRFNNNFQYGVFCQVCGKEGHSAVRCFKRFDHSYNGPS
jgi:hypothetical protein